MRVAVLGCGYVGLELGRQLADDGHDVVGVRRSDEGLAAIRDAGFAAVRADVTDPDDLEDVPDADALVFAASASGRAAAAARATYLDGLRTCVDHFGSRDESPERLVYTSSTGVYGDHDGEWVDEETPVEPAGERGEILLEAERIARSGSAAGTVVRFGGLYGPDRYRLERYLEGPVTAGHLNVIHRDDAAGAVRFLLERDAARDVVVAVDDEPVDKWAFADWLADECGVERPPKETVAERVDRGDLSDAAVHRLRADKRCSNAKLRSLGFEFEYPTYQDGYRDAIASYRRER